MRIILAALLGITLTSTAALAAGRAGTVAYNFDLSDQSKGEEVKLWIPYPVTDADQKITEVKITGDYAESGVYVDKINNTSVLFARWPKDAATRKLSYSFFAERSEISNANLPATEPAWNKADFERWLAPTSLGPTDGAVKELAEKITSGKKTVLEKAKAIYEWVCLNTYRDPNTRGCGVGDVCKLLETPGGKCADISSIYIALARASGVPSRENFGLRLGSKDGDDITGGQHCWVEFYLPGKGWVQIDPADVRKLMLKENLKSEDPKSAELRDYFWNGLESQRVKVSAGRDLMLTPRQSGAPLNFHMYPYAEIGGKPLDWLDPKTFRYSITFSTAKAN